MEQHICELLAELAVKRGAKDIQKNEGLYVMKIDDTWEAKCNPHQETIEGVPFGHWSLSFNGWPAGILHVLGEGILCAGEAGNEHTLREALLKQIALS